MDEQKKTEDREPCCTVKVIRGKDAEDCCSDAKGERTICVTLGADESKAGRTIKVVCCPDEKEAD